MASSEASIIQQPARAPATRPSPAAPLATTTRQPRPTRLARTRDPGPPAPLGEAVSADHHYPLPKNSHPCQLPSLATSKKGLGYSPSANPLSKLTAATTKVAPPPRPSGTDRFKPPPPPPVKLPAPPTGRRSAQPAGAPVTTLAHHHKFRRRTNRPAHHHKQPHHDEPWPRPPGPKQPPGPRARARARARPPGGGAPYLAAHKKRARDSSTTDHHHGYPGRSNPGREGTSRSAWPTSDTKTVAATRPSRAPTSPCRHAGTVTLLSPAIFRSDLATFPGHDSKYSPGDAAPQSSHQEPRRVTSPSRRRPRSPDSRQREQREIRADPVATVPHHGGSRSSRRPPARRRGHRWWPSHPVRG